MKLLRSTLVVSGMTLLSRIFGFVRDVVLARAFGASAATDAFYVALRIPNLMRRLFAEGSFSLAFVPVFSEYREKRSREELKDLLDCVAGSLAAVLLVVTAIGVLAAPGLVAAFAPGFLDQPAQFELASGMLRITFPYAMLISLTALAGGVLNSFGRFAVPAFTPVLLNIALIAAALGLAPRMEQPITALAWGVLGAGVIQLAFQFPSLVRLGLLPRPRVRFKHEGVQRIMRLMVPTLIGSSVAQINILIDTLIASFIAVGSITWLYYSDRLLEFPLGLFGIALSTVILPSLSRQHSAGDQQAFRRTLDWGLRVASLITLPAAVGLAVLAGPAVATLFNYGEFSAVDVSMTAASVVAYSLGLPAFVAVKVLAPAYYSRQDTRTPVRIAIMAMVTNMVLNGIFVLVLLQWTVAPPHAGLALASSIAAYLNAGLLYRGLRRDGQIDHQAGWGRLGLGLVVACMAMALAVLWLVGDLDAWLALGPGDRALRLGTAVGLGMAVYLAVVLAFRVPIKELKGMPN
ncbi:MAG: murein biosynthesis integral membrane protein MurJ [Xanthomonadales bacterium]|nr:murein biosynthesis integral membrane protein MurJ [Xanthomonadales bacterium]